MSPTSGPKKLWLYPLCPEAKALLRAPQLAESFRAALLATPSGTLPVKVGQMDSLLDVFRRAPDPRKANTRYRSGPVLTLIALALLAGRREIAEIARFATTLTQALRRRLNLPRKQGTRCFYQVPGYDVFYQVLTRMDPEAFAALLTGWLQQHHGQLPAALALDGKMIRDHIGLLTLAQHEDGTPHALAVYDQKENTPRCEQTAAAALLEQLPALDGKLITADPLHCQRALACGIVEKGGDYLFPDQRQSTQGAAAGAQARRGARYPLLAWSESGHGRVSTWHVHAFEREAMTAALGEQSLPQMREQLHSRPARCLTLLANS
jgi:hypothetical protein